MYFSAERLALANQAVRETFEQCSIVWQAIPHWDTGDPGQINVPNGNVAAPGFLPIQTTSISFVLTLAEVIAPTPDALLTAVITATKDLARAVDNAILPALYAAVPAAQSLPTTNADQNLLTQLIKARAFVEDAGYRAPSCLITNTVGLTFVGQLVGGVSILQGLLTAANINALHRASVLAPPNDGNTRLVLLGRRRRIPQSAAPEASPGEEPVDLAVSVLPSMEVDGETPGGTIQLTVRIRYATRITDATGLVNVHNP